MQAGLASRVAMAVLMSGVATAWADQNSSAIPGAATQTTAARTEVIQELVTDRPDFTESSEVVQRGLAQLEAGFSYEASNRGTDRSRSITLPASLLRVGLGRRTELRIGSDGFVSATSNGVRTSGYADLELGLKVRLFDQARMGVDVAIIPMMSVPTGANGFTTGAVDPTIKFTWARALPADFGLSGNVNVSSITDEAGAFVQRAVSVSLGHDLVGGWGGYIEGYAFTPMERGAATGATLDFGVSRPLGWRAQVDVEAGRKLTDAAPDWFVGVGIALRGHVGRARR